MVALQLGIPIANILLPTFSQILSQD